MTTNTQKHDVNSFFVTMKWHSETDKGHINTHNPLSQQCIIRINHGALFEKKKNCYKKDINYIPITKNIILQCYRTTHHIIKDKNPQICDLSRYYMHKNNRLLPFTTNVRVVNMLGGSSKAVWLSV